MSRVRKIDIDLREHNFEVKCEIFEDTENLALAIIVKDRYCPEGLESQWYGGHFNIEGLGLTEEKENWLALIMARRIVDAVKTCRKAERARVSSAWEKFQKVITLS